MVITLVVNNMPLSSAHRRLIRAIILNTLGGECCVCGSAANLEVHHKTPTLTGSSRGGEARVWDWLEELPKNNLSLLCHTCHKAVHTWLKVDDGDL